ncbi:MAG TPA: sulfotransferase [Flavobacteriales bacterium]|nr:sulfotransferase [Flavobacteriales bacterium]
MAIGRIEGGSFIFIIGAPRSGTTWLHRMLEQHPDIATAPRELTLFSRYLAPAYASFRKEKGHMDRGDWQQGLPMLMSEAEFTDGLRAITEAVYQRVLSKKPGASLILDKHPGYTFHLPLIEQLMPGGRYIHLLRDGRETAISMLNAREKLGFGARTMEDAAREWAESVQLAQLHGARVGESHFMELRYEDLVRNAEAGLAEILGFCGLPADQGWCARIAEENQVERKQVSGGDSSLNELRKTPGAIWRTRMGLRQRYVFDRVAGAWLRACGYGQQGWWRIGPLDGLLMAFYPLQLRIRKAVAAAIRVIRAQVFKEVPLGRTGPTA